MEDLRARADVLVEALPYIQQWAGTTMVVKYGGAAMVSPEHKRYVAQDLVLLQHVGIKTVVVHGGGPRISELMQRLGKEPVFVEGQRVTDAETMEIAQMVLVGSISQDLVGHIFREGGRAVSISGKDGPTIMARKKTAAGDVDLGHVGDITEVNPDLILSLAEAGYMVVVSTIGIGEDGMSYNINADTAAGAVAAALGAEKLVVLSDVPGVLRDPKDEGSLISELPLAEAKGMLKRGEIEGGMKPKLEGCVTALEGGVRRAHLLDGRLPHCILMELFTDRGVGTMIEAKAAPPKA
jgi:acetylglutamate kinase